MFEDWKSVVVYHNLDSRSSPITLWITDDGYWLGQWISRSSVSIFEKRLWHMKHQFFEHSSRQAEHVASEARKHVRKVRRPVQSMNSLMRTGD
jgi:hypothetical protein